MTHLSDEHGSLLLALARSSIGRALGLPSPHPAGGADDAWLLEPGAAFVTLKQDGDLRGCIGSLQARRPLGEDVAANAVAAATRDPRFPPLEASELGATSIEVSVLTAPEPLPVRDEQDARARLRPHVDGVVLRAGPWSSTFLPQVWEDLPDPGDFLAHLKRKAGLPALGWRDSIQLSTYQVTKFSEDRGR